MGRSLQTSRRHLLATVFVSVSTYLTALTNSGADVHIIAMSDQHSQIDKLETHILATHLLTREFLKRNPSGALWTLSPGDLSGPSEWTDANRGELGFEVLALQSKQRSIVYSLGNHEAFSFTYPTPEAGHRLFVEQSRRFQDNLERIGGQRVGWVSANVVAAPGLAELFQPFRDLQTPSGHRVRVLGLVLDEFFSVSSYDRSAPFQVVNDVLPMQDVARAQLEAAAQEGIDSVIIQAHLGGRALTERFVPQLAEWKRSHPDPRVRAIRIPFVLGAHNHERIDATVDGIRVLESGSRYRFNEIVLDDDARLIKVSYFDWNTQEALVQTRRQLINLSAEERLAIERTKSDLKAQAHLRRPLVETSGFALTRADMRRGSQSLGQVLAQTLVEWGKSEAKNFGEVPADAIPVGLYFSSAFRRDEPIAAGVVDAATVRSMYPFDAPIAAGVMTGRELSELHALLFEGVNDPYPAQLSMNLRQVGPGRLEIQNDGRWSPLNSEERLLVVMDQFIQSRVLRPQGVGLASRIRWLDIPRETFLRDVLVRKFAPSLKLFERRTIGICRDIFG